MKFEDLVGLTLIKIEHREGGLYLKTDTGREFQLYHSQDCCESVELEDINGELSDLIGSPLVQAEESTNSDNPKSDGDESYTWTFYKLATQKGHVVIRFYGSSNGYYSESVDFGEL